MDVAGAALLPKFGGYAVEDARGEVLALADERDEAERYKREGHDWYAEAAACGHPRARLVVATWLPLTVRIITAEEREEIAEGGTPLLQREP